jgi:hypothetical protein
MKRRLALILTLVASAVLPAPRAHPSLPLTAEEQTVKDALRTLLQRQDDAVLTGNRRLLRTLYTRRRSLYAFRHSLARQQFLRAWQRARGVRFQRALVELRTPRIKFRGQDEVRVTAVVSESFTYRSFRGAAPEEVFGLGTRRWYTLQREGTHWRIRTEDFTDPLDQDTRIPGEALPQEGGTAPLKNAPAAALGSAAEKSVHYADTYCGAATGCGNSGRYNPRYYDFNGEGGDCTNFVSQALRAAGFRQTGAWAWDAAKSDGTRSWSNADGLVDYLLASGRGHLIARGTYAGLTDPRPDGSPAPIMQVAPGDIIGYRERGNVVHLGLVVGRSATGYVLVDTHTADRYHVPWDIGWDRSTRFLLIKMQYPEQAPAT